MQRVSIQHYTANKDQGNDNIGSRHKEAPQCPLLRCSIPWDENYEGTILIEVPVVVVESLTEKDLRSSENGAWLDPGGDLSQFDYHYEERSKNPLESFQNALKKALCKHASKCPRMLLGGCSGEPKGSIQHDQPFETLNTPSSRGRKHENNEETSCKRKRKAKIHFNDLVDPEKPARRTRRLRIMRYLGLAPPLGSPRTTSR